MQRIIDKWNAAITDVLARFDATLAEATAGSQALIAHIGLDMTPLVQPWGAVHHQMHRHTEEVAEAWERISDELSEVDDLPDGLMFHEGGKRDWATTELEVRYTRAYRLAVAAAADVMRQRALQADARACHCVHCGATLDRIQLSGMALNVECGYCRAINTIEPGTALRTFAAVGAMCLAEREALPLWEAMTRALTQINQYRERKDVPLGLLQDYERYARGYWTTRIGMEADFVPEQRQFVEQKIDSYMKGVAKTLKQHWQWRQHAGA
jgi:phage FluMu protein Com